MTCQQVMGESTFYLKMCSLALNVVLLSFLGFSISRCSFSFVYQWSASNLPNISSWNVHNGSPTERVPSIASCDTWCPRSPICSSQFLFVVAVGRSGSTTLMNMINAIPGVFIYGEDMPLLQSLIDLDQLFLFGLKHLNVSHQVLHIGPLTPWARPRANRTKTILQSNRLLWELLAPPPDKTHVIVRGFKEIRWDYQLLTTTVTLFPCSRFIVNFRRDTKAQVASFRAAGWGKRINDTEVSRKTDKMRRLIKLLPVKSYEIALEDFSVTAFNDLAKWLGVNCEFDGLSHFNAQQGYDTDNESRAGCVPQS